MPNGKQVSVKELIESDDTLSDQACEYLLDFGEENSLVDYKESFDSTSDKCWLDLSIDVISFANTYGGYLVYGIKDKTYEKTGLLDLAYKALGDIKQVQEKISRGIQPKFTKVRSKAKEYKGIKYIFIFAPATKNRTHIFEQNMDYNPSGKQPITYIRQGSIYVRKSGSNQILTSDSFEEIMHRRIESYKDKLLENVARVVKAEPEQEVIIVSPDSPTASGATYKITDAPDAIAIKGTSFSLAPRTLDQKIVVWIAVNQTDQNNIPPKLSLMEVYWKRKEIEVTTQEKKELAYFCLIRDLPSFFWLQALSKEEVIEVLSRAFEKASAIEKMMIIKVSGFYGRSIYEGFFNKFARNALRRDIKPYNADLKLLFNTDKLKISDYEEEATSLAKELSEGHDQHKTYRLEKLDCGLYAPFSGSNR